MNARPRCTQAKSFDRGVFLLSLDTELAWGRLHDRRALRRSRRLIEDVPSLVDELLARFDAHQVPVTWAIVGALVAPPTTGKSLLLPRGLVAFPDLIERIVAARAGHEIAGHSFSHVDFREIDVSMAREDMQRLIEAFGKHGLTARSFVFPRDRVAHRSVLREHGFIAYRADTGAAQTRRLRRLAASMARLGLDRTSCGAPRVTAEGLVEVPGHLLFRIRHTGPRRFLPMTLLTSRSIAGLRKAIRRQEVFHVWAHPFNFAYRRRAHMEALDTLLAAVARYRASGELWVTTMGPLAEAMLAARSNPRRGADGPRQGEPGAASS